jgi:proteic killer suppression protein
MRYLQEISRRKLRMLNNSHSLTDLQVPPSNRLEKLKGNYKEYYSIRINKQWRIIFKWSNGNVEKVLFTLPSPPLSYIHPQWPLLHQ